MRLYRDFVEFLRAWCHLEASVGRKAPVKECRVLNDPKGLFGADFDQIPVSIILTLWSLPQFFVVMQHLSGGSCCLIRVRLTWPRTPFLWSSHLTALFGCARIDLLPRFERMDVALRKKDM